MKLNEKRHIAQEIMNIYDQYYLRKAYVEGNGSGSLNELNSETAKISVQF